MTSMTGKDPHPEVAEISDLSEGLLAPDRAAEVREHLAGCELCADVLASLEEIRSLLGTLPGPQRMPADVAGRIDAALAAEALLDAGGPRVPRETSSAPIHVPRETSTAPDGRVDTATGPGRDSPAGTRPGGRRRRGGLLAAASAAAVLLLGGVVYEAGPGGGSGGGSNADSAKKSDSAAIADPVAQQVRRLLDESGTKSSADSRTTTGPTGRVNTPMLSQKERGTTAAPAGPTTVPSCVLKATQRSQVPLAADRETYRGTESYLVVLPNPGDSGLVDAFVVNASCTAASPGAVLFQGTYPR